VRFHHMCIVTKDLEEAIRFWRDLMGFELRAQLLIPDGDDYGPTVMAPRALLEDLYKVPGAKANVAVLMSREGAMIELLQPLVPDVRKTPPERLLYADSGIRELGLVVDDIDAFFRKVRAAGYRTQTEYVWPCANLGRSFIFYDRDGNMIQIWEHAADAPAAMRAA
jgi:catechol 2,3-dioxygenase-like lactoylglutathione lyase family enzyme